MTCRSSDDLDRGIDALALDRQRDLGAGIAAHLIDRLAERQPFDRLAVQRGDQVAGLDSGVRGRRVVDRADHPDQPLILGDLDPEAAELALRLHLHVAELRGVHVSRMRIEPGQHAVQRLLDQLLVGHRLHVFGAHPLEHVAEQRQPAIRVGAVRRAVGSLRQRGLDAKLRGQPMGRGNRRDAGQEGGAEQQASAGAPGENPFDLSSRATRLIGLTTSSDRCA